MKKEGNININTNVAYSQHCSQSSAHTNFPVALNVTLSGFWNDIFKVTELIFSILKMLA